MKKITILGDNMPLSYLGHSPTTFPDTEICQYEGNFVTKLYTDLSEDKSICMPVARMLKHVVFVYLANTADLLCEPVWSMRTV
jgi:hypothetical protein